MVGEGESATTNQITEASRLLNMIIELRAADGMPAWAMRRGYVLPLHDVSVMNTDSHVVTAYDTTTLAADAAASATALTVASITGFSNGDQLGIELDSGNIDWTTINGAPSGTTITATTGLTTAASSGNRVYGYTASSQRVQKPIRITQADLLDVANGTSIDIEIVSHNKYFSISNRTTEGNPNTIYYNLEPSTLTALETNGQIFFYPRFSGGDYIIEFTYQRPLQDVDATGDNLDFPRAFLLPVMLELAALLGPKAGLSIEERRALFLEAKMYRDEALQTVVPEGSLLIQPNIDQEIYMTPFNNSVID